MTAARAGQPVAAADWDALYRRHGTRVAWGYDRPEELLLAMVGRHAVPPALAALPALEIGCGNGRNSLGLAAGGLRPIGLDFSRAALDHLRRRTAAIPLVQASAVALPFASASFAAAVDNGCLHAIHPAEHAAYAAEVARVVHRGGLLFLSARARPHAHPAAEPIFLVEGVPEWGFARGELEALFAARCTALETHLREGRGSERFHHLVLRVA